MGLMNRFMSFLGLQEEEEIIERELVEESDSEQEQLPDIRKQRERGHLVGLPTQKPTRMILSEPRSYEETQEIADHLRARRAVVVNLQRIRPELALRIVDFLSGTVYALSGGISKVGPSIFLCTPDTVEVHGAITEPAESEPDYQKMR